MPLTITKTVNFGQMCVGLTGVGYTLYGVAGNTVQARHTAGITEIAPGVYSADITVQSVACVIVWDTDQTPNRYAADTLESASQLQWVDFGSVNTTLTPYYTIKDATGTVLAARSATGVTHIAGGVYAANVTLPVASCVIVWDDDNTPPKVASSALELGGSGRWPGTMFIDG